MRRAALAIALMVPGTLLAGDGWPPASDYTYAPECGIWKGEKVAVCERNGRTFPEYYEKATKGDFIAQRAVMMVLSEETPGIKTRPVLACAWSEVILRSGQLFADADDLRNNKYVCGRLNDEERRLASAQADRMLRLLEP